MIKISLFSLAALATLYVSSKYYLKPQRKNSSKRPQTIDKLISNTPLLLIPSLSKATQCQILAKAEFLSPGGSSKDRVALSIIRQAETLGLIKPHTGCVLFEGTVGSTGISLAMLARSLGYECHIVMPDDQAKEKYLLLECLGATVSIVRPCSIVDKNHFVNVARQRALEMNKLLNPAKELNKFPTALFCDQFETLANYNAHFNSTGPEIYEQTNHNLDCFVMGAGTGGTLSGAGHYLRQKLPNLKIVLADPQGSGLHLKQKLNVLYSPFEKEGSRTRHQVDSIVEGMGQNRSTKLIDGLMEDGFLSDSCKVSDREAVEMSRYVMREDGIFIGSSTAVNLVAAYRCAKALGPGHTIVTILCDSGLRHLTKFWSKDYVQGEGLTPTATGLEFLD